MKRVSSKIFRKVETNNQLFLKNLQQFPLSVISYIIWYYFNEKETTQFAYKTNPFEFIFRYENKYTLNDLEFWKSNYNIRWFQTNLVLTFYQKKMWSEIRNRFTNFRDLESNKPTDSFNTYQTLRLKKTDVDIILDNNESIIKLPSLEYTIPKRYRPVSGGICFGYIKDKKIVSFAAAPHILNDKAHSFAILRGIETKLLERRHGYAIQTVHHLCQELFNKHNLNSIVLWVENSNEAAKEMYFKLGFKEEAKVFGTYCDLGSNTGYSSVLN